MQLDDNYRNPKHEATTTDHKHTDKEQARGNATQTSATESRNLHLEPTTLDTPLASTIFRSQRLAHSYFLRAVTSDRGNLQKS